MANIKGQYTEVIIKANEEYAFNDGDLSADTKTFGSVTCEMTPEQEVVDRRFSSKSYMDAPCNSIEGKKGGTVTLSGKLTKSIMPVILGGYFMNNSLLTESTTPLTLNTDTVPDSDLYSYDIFKSYDRGTTNVCSVAKGCVVESVELTPDDNGLWDFTINFRAMTVVLEEVVSYITDAPAVTCDTDFMRTVGVTSFMSDGDDSPIDTVTMKFSNEFIDDKYLYAGKNEKQKEVLATRSGEMTVEGLYESTQVMPHINLSDFLEITLSDGIGTASGDYKVIFTLNGIPTSVSLPDVEKGLYVVNSTSKLQNTGSGTKGLSLVTQTIS